MQSVSLTSWRENISHLEKWYDSEAGQQFLGQENKLLAPVVAKLFGYHLLQLSSNKNASLFHSSKIKHCIKLAPVAQLGTTVIADEHLPFAHESLDVVIAHHVLECSDQPYTLLKELSRVVLPSGYLVLAGFNPISLLGLKASYQRISKRGLWRNPLLSSQRLRDYLNLLDFSVESIQYGYYPLTHYRNQSSMCSFVVNKLEQWQWPIGGFYIVLAKKQVSRLTPLQLDRKSVAGRVRLLNPSLYQRPQNKEVNSCQNKK